LQSIVDSSLLASKTSSEAIRNEATQLSDTILAVADLNQVGYANYLSILASIWSVGHLTPDGALLNKLLPSMMRLVTHCSLQVSQIGVTEAEGILTNAFAGAWSEGSASDNDLADLEASRTALRIGDRVRLTSRWRAAPKLSAPSQSFDKAAEGIYTETGVLFDAFPSKPFPIPASILEIVRQSSAKLEAGSFVVINKKAPAACAQAGYAWTAAHEALIDTVARIDTVNDSATACRVVCAMGAVWIAAEGVTPSKNSNSDKQRESLSALIRAAFVAIYSLSKSTPDALPQVLDAILEVHESMSCALSSWLLGLLVKALPSAADAISSNLDRLVSKLVDVRCTTF
jgi:hypothetical protein